MKSTLIHNVQMVLEEVIFQGDLLIEGTYIARIDHQINGEFEDVIYGKGAYLLPGVIDCQVHFRDPGLTQKGDLHTESKAAIAGGVTSIIDMPNTLPNV
jgi:dihydroorotase